jgi:hypothetical protein
MRYHVFMISRHMIFKITSAQEAAQVGALVIAFFNYCKYESRLSKISNPDNVSQDAQVIICSLDINSY